MKGILSATVFNNFSSRCFGRLVARKRRRSQQRESESSSVNKKVKLAPNNVPAAASTSPVEYGEATAIVCLRPGQMLSFDGCAMVCLLEGRGSMQGYSLARGVHTLVYSCSDLASALTFEACQGNCKLEFSSYDLKHANHDSLSFKLELIDKKAEDRKRKTEWDGLEPERRVRPTLVPSDWSVTADSLLSSLEPPVLPICGVKGVGKSTFARFLVNKLLSRYKAVGYLDIDVGQPEFTIPGCMSLHILEEPVIGSPVSHMRAPERCFYFGDITPKSDPGMYLTYFKDLLDFFRETQSAIPLVINSPGWRTGTGHDILVDVLRYATPTYVVEIEHEKTDNLPSLPATCPILRIQSARPELQACDTKTAAELRALRVLSYFAGGGKRLFSPPAFDEAARALAFQAPYQVSADDFNIWHLHSEVPASQCLYSLNAQLVGLGISSSSAKGKLLVPCAGFGIIRGVKATERLLEIVTPCSPEILDKVDTILHGRLEIPAALLEVEGVDNECPYLCRSRVLDGTGSSILRRQYRPVVSTVQAN